MVLSRKESQRLAEEKRLEALRSGASPSKAEGIAMQVEEKALRERMRARKGGKN